MAGMQCRRRYTAEEGGRLVEQLKRPEQPRSGPYQRAEDETVLAEYGAVAVLCHSFDHISCSQGDELWAQAGRMSFAKMRCVYR